MPLQRLVLVSFILSSFIEANEEIRKSFFEESEYLSQCTFYYPILSDQKKMDIESERTFISKESIFLEEDVVLKFDGGLFTSSSADLKENSNLINFNNNADIFLNDLYLQAPVQSLVYQESFAFVLQDLSLLASYEIPQHYH
mgnify:CR=1 FL=1